MKNYYQILGVAQDATSEEIKKKYKELVRKYHPDVCKDENATEKIAEINCAYDILSNEDKRKKYDESLNNNTEYQDIEEEPFNYEEEINNFSEKEKEFARKIALEKVIKEEMSKLYTLLDARVEIISLAKSKDIIEDFYFEQIENWWQIANDYSINLQELREEAEKSNLSHLIPEINEVLNKLNEEQQGTPLTILEAEQYIDYKENKERVLKAISNDILEIKNILKEDVHFYKKVITGFINEDNYDSYKNRKLNELNKYLSKLKNMSKLANLYNLDLDCGIISKLEVYEEKLDKKIKNVPENYKEAKELSLKKLYYDEKDKLMKDCNKLINDMEALNSKMDIRAGNIVTKDELNEIKNRYSMLDKKLEDFYQKQINNKIDLDNLITEEYTKENLERVYDLFIKHREDHINKFFNIYVDSYKRRDIKRLLLRENRLLSGVCLLNAAAATLNIINKNYININIPATIVFTSINAMNLKAKYKIHKKNIVDAEKIINKNNCTKEEYKEYCLKRKIKTTL